MKSHPTLAPCAADFCKRYGKENNRLGLVDGKTKFFILLDCLHEVEEALLYVRTTQSTSAAAAQPPAAAAEAEARGEGAGRMVPSMCSSVMNSFALPSQNG